ncbi:MAG: glycosyltransferase [Chitinivibrionales bacterium]|nr:glycosyltransferase [Chitinivibrionales bacterium]
MKKVLLMSNTVMHYRVSVYNYFTEKFRNDGWELFVRTNKLQSSNKNPHQFDLKEIPLSFGACTREIAAVKPDAVIVFLHLKDRVIWPLLHWLKLGRIPFAYWTKGANLDDADNPIRNMAFHYIHTLSDRLILYSSHEMKYVGHYNTGKVFIANNTVNYHDYPAIMASKQQIKQELGIPFERVVLFAGRMGIDGGRKKVAHLIEVFRNLNCYGAGLVIVGSGLSEELQSSMNPRTTQYLGEVHDPANITISKIFAMADIFCIPGHVGLGLNQAMYWGLPVVTEEGKQPPEFHYLVDGRNGFVVAENDIAALRKRLILLLENKELREKLGQNAREDLLKEASIDNMYSSFYHCVESVVPGKPEIVQ